MKYVSTHWAATSAALLAGCLVLLSHAQPVAADPKQEKVDRLFRAVSLPLIDEADQIAQRLREDSGVCNYLSLLGRRKKLGKSWVPGNAAWERAASIAAVERATAFQERIDKYPKIDPWYPTRKDLMKITYRQFSDMEIDQLITQAESDMGQDYLL